MSETAVGDLRGSLRGTQSWILAGPRPMLIDGRWVISKDGRAVDVIDPFTNQAISSIFEATIADVDAAVHAARAAFDKGPWPRLSPNERARMLSGVAPLIARERERLAYIESSEMGKPITAALAGLNQAIFAWEYFAGKARDLESEVVQIATGTHFNYRTHDPVGVVAEIIPWNGAVVAASQKLGAILCTGNTAVLKPSVEATLSVLALGELLLEAGFPAGVVNIVTGPGSSVGDALLRHTGVDMVSLTGGVDTGRRAVTATAETLKRVSLELGGKNPNIVFADADLDSAATSAVGAAFNNAGQICVSGSRLLLEDSIRRSFVDQIVELAQRLRIGDPLDPATQLGPLVSRAQYDKVLEYIRLGIAEGATLLCGGDTPLLGDLAHGNFVRPTIFADVVPTMRIAQDEIFGPVLAIMRFEGEEQALAIANGVDYGLAGAVWTGDLKRALRVASRLDAGQVYVNGYFNPGMSESPAVGRKRSGTGAAGYLKYTVPKTVFVRH